MKMKIYKNYIVASELIKSLNTEKKVNYYGEPVSRYFPLAEHNTKKIVAAITLENNGIDNTLSYSIHCINDFDKSNFVIHTDTIKFEELTEALKDVLVLALSQIHLVKVA